MSQTRARILRSLKDLTKQLNLYPLLSQIRRRYNLYDYDDRLRSQSRLYSEILNPGDLCFDVGANVGRKTEVFLRLGARVVAFEPQPDCAREIRLRCQGLGTFWVEECAIGRSNGTVDLDLGARSGLAAVVESQSHAQGQVISVPVHSLDTFVETYGVPTFCKIDVEGFEMEVLKGLSTNPKYLSLEYHTRDEADVAHVMECLTEIEARYDRPRANYTAGQSAEFALDQFRKIGDVKDHFEENWEQMPSFGDIFIHG